MLDVVNMGSVSKIFSNPTWDILVISFFLFAGFFYGVLAGRKKLLSVLFSLYVSILLTEHFPYLNLLTRDKGLLDIFLIKLSVFLVFIVFLTILFNKTVFRSSAKDGKWWQTFVLSFLEVGLFVSSIFYLLSAKELFVFSSIVESLFASGKSFFWWMVLPLVFLFFIIGKRERKLAR